jgi:hypothetical protein
VADVEGDELSVAIVVSIRVVLIVDASVGSVADLEGDELSVAIVISVTIGLIVKTFVAVEVTVSVVWMIGDVDAATGGEVSTGSVVGGVAGSVAAGEGEVTVVIVVVSVVGIKSGTVVDEGISNLVVDTGDSMMGALVVVSRNTGGRSLNSEILVLTGFEVSTGIVTIIFSIVDVSVD